MAEASGIQDGQDSVLTDVLIYAASGLVDKVDDVRVEFEDGDPPIYRLLVHDDDLGRVIGRGGRTARALRGIGKAAAAKNGVRAFIRIGDETDR